MIRRTHLRASDNPTSLTSCWNGEVDPERIVKAFPLDFIRPVLYGVESFGKLVNLMNKKGWIGGPVLVILEANGESVIFDGTHRIRAAVACGLSVVPVKIHTFGRAYVLARQGMLSWAE
jgi:hypothetical protein